MASVRKRTWTGSDGKPCEAWVVEYTDADGKRRRETPKSGLKKDAEAIRRKIEGEQTLGKHLAASKTITVAKLVDLYREHNDARCRDGKIGKGRVVQMDVALRSIASFLGSKRLTDLTSQDVEDYYEHEVRDRGLLPNSGRHRIYNLKLLQEFAIRRQLMVKDPVTQALKNLGSTPRETIRVFSKDEVLTLLRTAAQRGYKRRPLTTSMTNCLVNLATFCGLRYGEIIGLRLQYVDLEKRILHIRHSFDAYTQTVKSPKTRAGIRDVPMPPHVVAMLREWIDVHRPESDLDLVFVTSEGKWLQQSNFRNNNWLPLLKRAGLDGGETFHFHSLRHFAASWMIDGGIPLTEVARLLGHSKFDMTLQVYAHPVHAPSHAREAMDLTASRLLAAPLTIDMATNAPTP